METICYSYLNYAKTQLGDFREAVNTAVRSNDNYVKKQLFVEIEGAVSNLNKSKLFFRQIGKACEIEMYLIAYKSLLARLHSSL